MERQTHPHIHTSPLLRLAFLLVVMVCVCCVVDWRRCGERKRNRFNERRAFFSSLAASVGWRSSKGKRFGWYLSCAFRCNVFGMCLSLSFSSRLFWLMIATSASWKRIEKGLDWNYCEDYRREFTVRCGIGIMELQVCLVTKRAHQSCFRETCRELLVNFLGFLVAGWFPWSSDRQERCLRGSME